ncbi:MAG: MarR family transcriptional regulator [Acidimicrobiaceae bacterium]|nr:MarR family transcriptional regulator [Acidimicrobiaceae bacterium]
MPSGWRRLHWTAVADTASTASRWLNDTEMRAWRAYVETQADLNAAIEADLRPTGLSLGDYQVLVFLSEAPDRRMRMCDLADDLQLSPSGLTRRLDGIVRRGWVERIGSDDDRRVMLAALTADGLAMLEAAAPTHVDSVRRRLVDLLDDDELVALGRIFDKVRAGLDAG